MDRALKCEYEGCEEAAGGIYTSVRFPDRSWPIDVPFCVVHYSEILDHARIGGTPKSVGVSPPLTAPRIVACVRERPGINRKQLRDWLHVHYDAVKAAVTTALASGEIVEVSHKGLYPADAVPVKSPTPSGRVRAEDRAKEIAGLLSRDGPQNIYQLAEAIGVTKDALKRGIAHGVEVGWIEVQKGGGPNADVYAVGSTPPRGVLTVEQAARRREGIAAVSG